MLTTQMSQMVSGNTNRDGTGAMVTAYVPPATGNGGEIIRVDFQASVTTVASMVRLFLSDGTNIRLYAEIPVAAVTPSGTVQAWSGSFVPSPRLEIPPGWSLRAAENDAAAINVIVTAFNY